MLCLRPCRGLHIAAQSGIGDGTTALYGTRIGAKAIDQLAQKRRISFGEFVRWPVDGHLKPLRRGGQRSTSVRISGSLHP
jgi:hypothetical protein